MTLGNDTDSSPTPLLVALGQYDTGWHSPSVSLERAADVVRRAAEAGAGLVALPEMCATGFTMEADAFAETEDGPSARALAELARRNRVSILAGLALRSSAAPPSFHNAALLFDRSGAIAAGYRKQRLFRYSGEQESYTPGAAPVVMQVDDVALAPFICYDLRFPELFRPVAPRVDLIAVIANWPAVRRPHWDVLVRARAIENQCYVVAINRTGEGGGVTYDGGSVAYDPWGEPIATATTGDAAPAIACIDPAVVGRIRSRYGFVSDERMTADELG